MAPLLRDQTQEDAPSQRGLPIYKEVALPVATITACLSNLRELEKQIHS